MLQQHPHHRGLGNKGVDTGDEFQIAGRSEHLFGKSGAVVVVHRFDPVPYRGGGQGGGVDGQVTTLGMAAQNNRTGAVGDPGGKVVQGGLLSGDGVQKAHVEVLFPAYQSGVGPPEGQEGLLLAHADGQRGKLSLLLGGEDILVEGERQPGKPGSVHQGTEELAVVVTPYPILRRRFRKGEKSLGGLGQRHAGTGPLGDQVLKMNVG